MKSFSEVQEAIRPCTTFSELTAIWIDAQPSFKVMDRADLAALIAMKDFYKGMMERNEIEDYQKARKAAACGEWSNEPPPARKVPEKKRRR